MSKIPPAGQTEVDPTTTREITLTFNKHIDANTITPTNIQILERNIELILSLDSIKLDSSEKNKVVIELPRSLSFDTTYILKLLVLLKILMEIC